MKYIEDIIEKNIVKNQKMNKKRYEGSFNINELENLVQILSEFDLKGILLFEGEMGAGKTTFIQYFLKSLGISNDVSSPTFSLVTEYHSDQLQVIHADLYRVKHISELEGLGLEFNGNNLILIEWGSQFQTFFNPIIGKIVFSKIKDKPDQRHYLLEIYS